VRASQVLHILYLWAVVVGAAVLLGRLFPAVDLDFGVELAVLVLVLMAAEWLVVSFPHGQLSSSYAVTFGTFLLFGPAAAAWVSALGTLFGQGIANRGNPVRTTLFNAAQTVLAVYGAYLFYLFCGGTAFPGEMLVFTNVLPLLAFSAAHFLLNHLLVYLYLLPGGRLRSVGWRQALSWDASTYLFLVPLGFLVAMVYQGGGFTAAFLVLLLSLVVQVFLHRYVRLALTNQELRVLYEVARRLGSNHDSDAMLDMVLRETRRIVPYHTAAVYLWSEERGLFVPAVVHSPYAAELQDIVYERAEGIVGWTAENRESCLVADTRTDPLWAETWGLTQFLRSLLVIPLVHEDEVLGVMVIGERRPDAYHEGNLHLLNIVAGQVAVAVDNARLRRRMDRLAGYDPLTGLPNRYHFQRQLQGELGRTRNQDLPLAVVLVDVGGLRSLNARFGFAVGDHALIQVARLLEEKVAPTGTVARYGGATFALLLPGTGEIRAADLTERLERAVGQLSFGAEGREERLRLTVRSGLAVSPLDGATPQALLRRAEEKLYTAVAAASAAVWGSGDGSAGV
jgi:diguanylate cyclase (GGDEF)-like protein